MLPPKGDWIAMKDLIDIYAGNIAVFGYSVPTIWLVAGGFLLVAAVMRSLWPALVVGVMLFAHYFIPMMAGG